jgi:hypothetical protein
MKNHFVLMLIFSILTSLVLAYIGKSEGRARLRYFLVLLGSFVILSIVAGWLMYPFPF